jgi:hypothetical protein
MPILKILPVLFLLCFASACATNRYAWHHYDEKLYRHYKNPAEHEEFVEQLKKMTILATREGKVPPGLYAEYGYVLYEGGEFQEAEKYFRLESEKWPESRVFMDKMVNYARMSGNRKTASAQTAYFSGPKPENIARLPAQEESTK